jgi:hypothetical protein
MDEVDDDKMAAVITLVQDSDPQWKMGLAYFRPTVTSATKSAMYDLSGLITLATGTANPISTFYTSCAPTAPNDFVTPSSSPADMTWLPWHAANEHLNGYLRWAFDLRTNPDPFDVRDGNNTAGDFSLAYHPIGPTGSEFLSSIRLELLRDGIQDFEKLRILQGPAGLKDPSVATTLKSTVDNFSTTTGESAESLVRSAQQTISDIAVAISGSP